MTAGAISDKDRATAAIFGARAGKAARCKDWSFVREEERHFNEWLLMVAHLTGKNELRDIYRESYRDEARVHIGDGY